MIPHAAEIARSHHERYDGKGYPDGLAGTEIPIHARIVAVADCYDAMNSRRIYRNALPPEVFTKNSVKPWYTVRPGDHRHFSETAQ